MDDVVKEICQIGITVSNVTSAIAYYRDVLGLKFLFSAGENLAFLTDGSIRLMLSTPQGAGSVGSNSILYFKVKNIEVSYATMIERGSATERPPQFSAKMPDHDLWIGFLRDPDGNLIGLMEEKHQA